MKMKMKTKTEVSNEVLDFLTGIHGGRGDQEKRKEKIFDRAFELAYKDMATHTVAYTDEAKQNYVGDDSKRCKENKVKIRNTIKEHIKTNIFGDVSCGDESWSELLKQINSQDASDKSKKFNDWHEHACETFVEINCSVSGLKQKGEKKTDSEHTEDIKALLHHTDSEIDGVFTYGQAQKLINMMVKYLYIFYQCEGWDDLKNLAEYAHVPIDSYVLNEVGDKKTAWSKIGSYTDYERYKESISKAKEDNCPPFLWELANWPFNN